MSRKCKECRCKLDFDVYYEDEEPVDCCVCNKWMHDKCSKRTGDNEPICSKCHERINEDVVDI
jgi:hypothetical protein